jgi:hypothetical protein
MPECQCEEWELDHDDQGWFHMSEDYNPETDEVSPVAHRHTKPTTGERCNICDWLNADEPLDLLTSSAKSASADIPIKPVWIGAGYEWEPVGGEEE